VIIQAGTRPAIELLANVPGVCIFSGGILLSWAFNSTTGMFTFTIAQFVAIIAGTVIWLRQRRPDPPTP